jgi:hypothetical protein
MRGLTTQSRICTVGTRFPAASHAGANGGSTGLHGNSLVDYDAAKVKFTGLTQNSQVDPAL